MWSIVHQFKEVGKTLRRLCEYMTLVNYRYFSEPLRKLEVLLKVLQPFPADNQCNIPKAFIEVTLKIALIYCILCVNYKGVCGDLDGTVGFRVLFLSDTLLGLAMSDDDAPLKLLICSLLIHLRNNIRIYSSSRIIAGKMHVSHV